MGYCKIFVTGEDSVAATAATVEASATATEGVGDGEISPLTFVTFSAN